MKQFVCNWYLPCCQCTEIDATLIPFSPSPESRSPHDIPPPSETVLPVFPDSGATICLGGSQHLRAMGLSQNNLIPSQKVVRTVGNYTLVCQGWIPVKFVVGEKCTKQALYICNKIDRIYFSRSACVDVGILSPQFPHPVSDSDPVPCEVQWAVPSFQASGNTDPAGIVRELPARPDKLPFSPHCGERWQVDFHLLHSTMMECSQLSQGQMVTSICRNRLFRKPVIALYLSHFTSRRL